MVAESPPAQAPTNCRHRNRHRTNCQLLRQIRSTGSRSGPRAPDPTAWATGQRPQSPPPAPARAPAGAATAAEAIQTTLRSRARDGLPACCGARHQREEESLAATLPAGRTAMPAASSGGGGLGSRPCRPAWERRERGMSGLTNMKIYYTLHQVICTIFNMGKLVFSHES